MKASLRERPDDTARLVGRPGRPDRLDQLSQVGRSAQRLGGVELDGHVVRYSWSGRSVVAIAPSNQAVTA